MTAGERTAPEAGELPARGPEAPAPPSATGGPDLPAAAGDPERSSRRAVPVLAAAQVLGGVGVASGFAVNGVLAKDLSDSTALSGVAQTMGVIGAALLAVPLARLADRSGRRPALASGYLVGAVGGALCVLAAVLDTFWVLLVGAALFGGGTASGLQARYAAIDGVRADRRGRALSLVVWATTVGSVAGPNLSAPGGALGESLGLPTLAGPYLISVTGFAVSAVLLWLLLRPDPLLTARSHGGGPVVRTARLSTLQALAVVRARPAALLGLVALGTGHAVMVSVMVMTPVHLLDGGAGLEVIGVVFSGHVAGMYALSPLMGWVADRYGRRTGIGLGVGLLVTACLLAAGAPPHSHVVLGLALTVLGLGWSASVVAGSTLLSESVPADVRTGVQGFSDLSMGVVAAAAGALAGPVVAGFGYSFLATAAVALLLPVLALMAFVRNPVEAVGGTA